MTKGRARCANPVCNNTITVEGRNRRDADWYAEKLQRQGATCQECRAAEHAKAATQAADQARAEGLPDLTGSACQIQWAETLRRKWLDRAGQWLGGDRREQDRWMGGYEPSLKIDDPRYLVALEQVKEQSKASWWIDHRDEHPGDALNRLAGLLEPGTSLDHVHHDRAIIAEAQAEATIRPAGEVVTESVTEVRVVGDAIEVAMPEKRDDFREVVKLELRLRWNGKCWHRKIPPTAGKPQDRAAELACRLLAEGFPVRIHDEDIRAQVASGDYPPEIKTWIMVRTMGRYAGWFVITWRRPDDYYRAAQRLTGSRYDPPGIVVPPEHYDEVQDFADLYEFAITDLARAAMDRAAAVRAGASVVASAATAPVGVTADTTAPTLDPDAVSLEIADELRDTDD